MYEEREILSMLVEECAEVIHAVTKIFRHGENSYNPEKQGVNNLEQLNRELGDLFAVVAMAQKAGMVRSYKEFDIVEVIKKKQRYMHFKGVVNELLKTYE